MSRSKEYSADIAYHRNKIGAHSLHWDTRKCYKKSVTVIVTVTVTVTIAVADEEYIYTLRWKTWNHMSPDSSLPLRGVAMRSQTLDAFARPFSTSNLLLSFIQTIIIIPKLSNNPHLYQGKQYSSFAAHWLHPTVKCSHWSTRYRSYASFRTIACNCSS